MIRRRQRAAVAFHRLCKNLMPGLSGGCQPPLATARPAAHVS